MRSLRSGADSEVHFIFIFDFVLVLSASHEVVLSRIANARMLRNSSDVISPGPLSPQRIIYPSRETVVC